MFRKNFIILMLLLAVITSDALAQFNQVLYFMNLPQRTSLNPALRPTSRFNVGLPVVSDISIFLDNNFLNFSDLFLNGVISDSTFSFLEPGDHLNAFLEGLNNKNSVEPQAAVQLFGLGFTVGKDLYITFDLTERFDANIVFPGDLLKLGINGSEGFMGQRIDLSSLRADFKYYHEIGLGISKNFTERLRIGLKGKVLLGVTAGYLDNNGFGLRINDDYTHSLDADMTFNISGPVNVYPVGGGPLESLTFDDARFDSSEGIIAFLTNAGNPGLGFDIGAEYRISERISVSAAVTDLGFIRWKTDRAQLKTSSQFTFSGMTMQDVYEDNVTFNDLLSTTFDSLKSKIYITDGAPFSTFLPVGLTVAGSYSPVKVFSVGLLSHTRFIGKQVHEALTISANVNLGNALSATATYTAANQKYDNLGAGLSLRAGYLQLYTLIDNVPFNWSKAHSGERSYSLPESWNTVHIRLGLNLTFGNKIKERPLTLTQPDVD